jgi:hypothetical protein
MFKAYTVFSSYDRRCRNVGTFTNLSDVERVEAQIRAQGENDHHGEILIFESVLDFVAHPSTPDCYQKMLTPEEKVGFVRARALSKLSIEEREVLGL